MAIDDTSRTHATAGLPTAGCADRQHRRPHPVISRSGSRSSRPPRRASGRSRSLRRPWASARARAVSPRRHAGESRPAEGVRNTRPCWASSRSGTWWPSARDRGRLVGVFGPGGGPRNRPGGTRRLVRTAFTATTEDIGGSAAAGAFTTARKSTHTNLSSVARPGPPRPWGRRPVRAETGRAAGRAQGLPGGPRRGDTRASASWRRSIRWPAQSDETAEVGERPADV